MVAPLAGAWIEICTLKRKANGKRIVAPLAGAWIEIESADRAESAEQSLPSRERGLKYLEILRVVFRKVAPLAGAWIEITYRHWLSGLLKCRSPRGSVD